MADGILNPIEQLEAEIDFDVYTKQEVDALLDEKADKSDTYTKTETDALLDDKADADSVYTKTETDTLLSAKADKSTTLAGYGITDAYSKTQTDNLLNGKADADSVYTKTEIDTKIPNTVGSATKPTYVNGGVITECTYELNKTVPANAVFTDTTYTAGNGLNLIGTSFSAKAGANVSVDSGGINVNGNGVVASADSGLVSGGTAYTELRPTLDGTWVKNAQTTAINLQKLEGGIEYLYGLLSHQYDQLKKYINGNYYDYDTDTDSKYTKTVPQGAMPYASLDSIGGKTVVWNQLNNTIQVTTTKDGLTFTNNNDGSWTIDGTATADGNINIGEIALTTHKYFLRGCPSGGSDATYGFGVRSTYSSTNIYLRDYGSGAILTWGANNPSGRTVFGYHSGDVFNNATFLPQIIDLTLMFGSGNEPTTVAEFQQMFPASYYSYNAGTLLSAGVTEVVSEGKNLFNEDATAEIVGSYRYYHIPLGATNTLYMTFSDKDTSVNISGIYIGFIDSVVYGAPIDFRWVISNGAIQAGNTNIANNKKLPYVFVYPKDDNTFNKLNNRYNICVSTQNSFSPYKAPISYPIPAEVQALEGYGWSAGTAFNYIDYERKVFVQNVVKVTFDGTENWSDVGGNAPYRIVPTNAKTYLNTETPNILSVEYTTVPWNATFTNYNKMVAEGSGYWRFRDTSCADLSAWTTKLSVNPLTVYYELATPQEIDISAYLTDDNLIEVEAGGTLTFPNSNGTDYQIPVPSAETYMVNLQGALGE